MNLYTISLIFVKKGQYNEFNNVLDQCIAKSAEEALKVVYNRYADLMALDGYYIQQYNKLQIDLNLKF